MTRLATSWRLLGILALAFAVAHCGDGGGDNDNFDDSGSPPPGTFTGRSAPAARSASRSAASRRSRSTATAKRSRRPSARRSRSARTDTFDVRLHRRRAALPGPGRFLERRRGRGDDRRPGRRVRRRVHGDARRRHPTRRRRRRRHPAPWRRTTATPGGGEDTSDGDCRRRPVPSRPARRAASRRRARRRHRRLPPPVPSPSRSRATPAAKKVLDSGWTGLAHNATVISDGKLTFTLDCTPENRPCGVCQVGGPIQNLDADQGDINARRCSNDTSIKCTATAACGSGTCDFFFGAPLPLAAGGIGTCVTNQVNGAVSGTANIESGAFASADQP